MPCNVPLRRRIVLAAFLVVGMMFSISVPLHAETSSDGAIYLPLIIGGSTTTTVTATNSLQSALDAAKPGDVITLQSTTYTQDLIIRRSGTATAPITLRGAGVGKSIIAGKLRVQDAAYVVIQDLDVNAAGKDDAIRITAPAQYVTVQRVHLYGGSGYGVRIENDVAHVVIEDSEINNFDAGSSDAHGVGIMTANDVTVRRCNIYGNSGDSVQVNTPDYPGYKRFASNITIEGNNLHENRENAVDIKSARGVVVRNNRMWGFRAVDSSDGMAIEVQYDAQDVTITGNEVWDAVEGLEITRGKKNGVAYPAAPQRVTVAGNLMHDFVNEGGDSASGSGIVVRSSGAVKVYNNTILRAASAAVYVSYSDKTDLPTNVDIRNNVFDGTTNDLYFAATPANFAGLIVDYNHYVNGTVNGSSLATWLAKGFEKHATTGNPVLSAASLPLAASPLLDSGVDVGQPFTGSQPDRGWGEFAPNS